MEVSIQEVARLAGTTSRTLRHYDAIGLLPPSRVADNGYRWYDGDALVRLQRILLLRDLGLPLQQIGRVLDRQGDETGALRDHLTWLRTEQHRLARQIASVERTITARTEGGRLMAEDMLDGFDHTRYREEVEQRRGADAYASGDRWWRSMSAHEQAAWRGLAEELGTDWRTAAAAGLAAGAPAAQAPARGHEQRQQRLGHPQRAQHVDLIHPAPVLDVGRGHRVETEGSAGDVDQRGRATGRGDMLGEAGDVGR